MCTDSTLIRQGSVYKVNFFFFFNDHMHSDRVKEILQELLTSSMWPLQSCPLPLVLQGTALLHLSPLVLHDTT